MGHTLICIRHVSVLACVLNLVCVLVGGWARTAAAARPHKQLLRPTVLTAPIDCAANPAGVTVPELHAVLNAGRPLPLRKDASRAEHVPSCQLRDGTFVWLAGQRPEDAPRNLAALGMQQERVQITNKVKPGDPLLEHLDASDWAFVSVEARRADNSRGPGGPTGPLGTPPRTPWILSI